MAELLRAVEYIRSRNNSGDSAGSSAVAVANSDAEALSEHQRAGLLEAIDTSLSILTEALSRYPISSEGRCTNLVF